MLPRVLHLLSQRPGWTGSGVAIDAMVRAADRNGWNQCAVVGTPDSDPTPSVGDLEGSSLRPLIFGEESLSFPLPGMSDVMPYPTTRFSEMTGKELSLYRRAWECHLSEVIAAFAPDIIHSHHVWLMSSWVKNVASTTPVVTHCHGTGLRQMELCPHLAAQVRAGCARNDAFVVLHRGQAAALRQGLGIDAGKIHVVGSGFRDELFHDRNRPLSTGPTVTYVGKLSRAKGLPWLIEAIDKLASRIPDIVLQVAGSGAGSEAAAIRRQMEASKHVVYHAQLDQVQLADLLRQTAVFALPSFFEGLPLVLVEAAACGCRLVSTALPGVEQELQPMLGESLQMVPLPRLESIDRPVPADLPTFVDQLIAAVESSLEKPSRVGGADLVTGMTWDAVFRRIERVWRSVITEAHSGSPGPTRADTV